MKRADAERLLELAGKATPGPWKAHDCGFHATYDRELACGIVTEAKSPKPWSREPEPSCVMVSDNRDECTHPILAVDAEFIAAANPHVVSHLLAERSKLLEHVRGSRREHTRDCDKTDPWFQGVYPIGILHDKCTCGADAYNACVDTLLTEVDS